MHHFFDPFKNRALTAFGTSAFDTDIHKNLDWAIGTRDAFGGANTPETGRRNHFSLFDAREAMFRAATLKWKNTDGTYPNLALGQVDAATKELWRKAYWATTFRALGDALHLIQDMAQPQHTRNEPHSGMACLPFGTFCFGGHTSIYEKYIDARIRPGTTAFASGAPFNIPSNIGTSAVDFGNYPIPTFQKYSDFWSTSPGSGSLTGQGLADYSNRGFFTAKYNLGNTEYQNPSSTGNYAIEARAPTRWDQTPIPNGAPVYVYKGDVPDTVLNNPTPNVALTSYGLWDQFLLAQGATPGYTLNRINYDAMADLLIPRAVAYSAGLINYFFRGKLQISLPDEGVYAIVDHSLQGTRDTGGFRQIKVKVQNVSSTDAGFESMQTGKLFAVVRYHRNSCYQNTLDGEYGAPGVDWHTCRDPIEELVASEGAAPPEGVNDSPQPVVFDFSDVIPVNATDIQLQVVFRGTLGQESDAIAIGARDISEPTFMSYINSLDYDYLGQPPVVVATNVTTQKNMHMGFSSAFPALVETGPVAPGQFVRVALLTDTPYYAIYCECYSSSYYFDSAINQANVDVTDLASVPYQKIRGVHLGSHSSNFFTKYNFVVSLWRELSDDDDPQHTVLQLFPNIDPSPQPIAAINFPQGVNAALRPTGLTTEVSSAPDHGSGARSRIK